MSVSWRRNEGLLSACHLGLPYPANSQYGSDSDSLKKSYSDLGVDLSHLKSAVSELRTINRLLLWVGPVKEEVRCYLGKIYKE